MKTLKLMGLIADAISSVVTVLDVIKQTKTDDTELLTTTEYTLLSGSVSMTRDLFEELPEGVREGEMERLLSKFYLHLYRGEDETGETQDYLIDLKRLNTETHDHHRIIFAAYFEAQRVVALYS